jgi:hypothetical protein
LRGNLRRSGFFLRLAELDVRATARDVDHLGWTAVGEVVVAMPQRFSDAPECVGPMIAAAAAAVDSPGPRNSIARTAVG